MKVCLNLQHSYLYWFCRHLSPNPSKTFHCLSDFQEAGAICSFLQCAFSTFYDLVNLVVDGEHGAFQLFVDLCSFPIKTLRILCHFESTSCYASSICSFARNVKDLTITEFLLAISRRGEISPFKDSFYAYTGL